MKWSLNKDRTTLFLMFLTGLWMVLIFWFSAQPADESSQMSGFVKECLDRILYFFFRGNLPGLFLEGSFFTEHVIRKLGHVTEFMILGVFTSLTSRRLFSVKAFFAALLICILYASSDEFHQVFVPGRGPMVTDVLLDSAASIIGIFIAGAKCFKRLQPMPESRSGTRCL